MTAHAVELDPGAGSRSGLGELGARLAGRWKLGLYAELTRYGLVRDLSHNFQAPGAKIPLAVRPLADRDLAALFGHAGAATELSERMEVAWRRAFIEKGARGGFVAIDERSATPCYVQWLLSPRDNAFIKKLGGFPPLADGEALLENAYTPPAYRGLGVMAAAMAQIAERASDFSARKVLTFVATDNIASLKGCQRAGFYPHLLHRRTRFGFGLITRDRFETLPEGDPRRSMKF
ncbi:MAG TPA: GNAT family N-acetyltransferase [Xanthobacteraceae bacterium]|jgi:RimJ/RimL family protein N-acetyltransferase|nr:GNAT family N-acetyltransferase [Xanthobacteraceae bacterium]